MIRHVLKLVWNRKRANALIMIEILFSFLVVFGVVTAAAASFLSWRRPLGYDWQNVWTVRVSLAPAEREEKEKLARNREIMRRFVDEIRSFPQVAAVGASSSPPFSGSTWEGNFEIDGIKVWATRDFATDGYADALSMKMIRGRWFRPEDDAASYIPVVVDSDLAQSMYPGQDPLGRKFDMIDAVEYRIIGVIPPYRKDGEFSRTPMNMAFHRSSLVVDKERTPRSIVVKLKAGADARFEEALNERLHQIAPDVSFRIRHMDKQRAQAHRVYLLPMIVGGVVSFFLIAMVTLGLTGVLWQNVTRRTREIGLRRALGASGGGVRKQVLFEVAMLATLAITAGVVIVAQLPVLGAFQAISPTAFAAGVAGALAIIYGLTLLCAAYPGWLASRLHPAEALRYE
jgi:putative ABC transport system permease protein